MGYHPRVEKDPHEPGGLCPMRPSNVYKRMYAATLEAPVAPPA
jgi:hypothetical protein